MLKPVVVKAFWLPVGLTVVVLTLCLWLWARDNYPVLDGDALCFVPIGISWAAGRGLVNPLYHPAHVVDAARPEILTWHGFASPMLLGTLATSPDNMGLRWSMAALQFAILLAMLAVLAHLSRARRDFPTGLLTGVALSATLSFAPVNGRPEMLVALWLIIGLWLVLRFPVARWWFGGSVVGLSIVTSPAPALLLMPLLLFAAILREQPRDLARSAAQMGAACLATIALSFQFYPFGFVTWLQGTLLHTDDISKSWGMRQTFYYWMIHPSSTGFGLLFGGVAALGISLWCQLSPRRQVGGAACLLVFSALLWQLVGRVPAHIYNLTALAPLGIALIFRWGISPTHFGRRTPRWRPRVAPRLVPIWGAGTILLGCSAGFARAALLYLPFREHGTSYRVARTQLAQIRQQARRERGNDVDVAVSPGLVNLTEDYSHLRIMQYKLPGARSVSTYFLLQQVNRSVTTPPPISHYSLIANGYSSQIPILFGHRFANTVGGYNYALYHRDADPSSVHEPPILTPAQSP